MRDDTEAAVRALPPFLQRRMAHLVLRGWNIECAEVNYGSAPKGDMPTRMSWTARYNRIADEASYPYELKIYSSSTLMTLLDRMAGVVESMGGEIDDLKQRLEERWT